MPLLSAAPTHDPFWGLDGKSAQHARLRRRITRFVTLMFVAILAALLVALVATRLPTVDPQFVLTGAGRPILVAAILSLLGSTMLLGLSRLRHPAPR
jgi:preprotein translocase subunit SecY